MDATEKLCSRCGIKKPIEEFHRNRCRVDGLAVYCKPCTLLYNNTYYADKAHDRLVAKIYGLERGEYAKMLEAQGGVCAICKEPETAVLWGRVKRLSVDHDHETGMPRALLCLRCNVIIGYAADNVQRLLACIEYLEVPRPVVEREQLGPLRSAKCGTYSGYTAHYYRREKPCGPCKDARRTYDASKKQGQ